MPSFNQLDCAICLEPYSPEESRRTLECNHEFHTGCIDTWLTEKRECPICRRKIESLAKKAFYFSSAVGFCIGSGVVIINHVDKPIQGLFKTSCFALSYILAMTGADLTLQDRSSLLYFKLSGTFALAYHII